MSLAAGVIAMIISMPLMREARMGDPLLACFMQTIDPRLHAILPALYRVPATWLRAVLLVATTASWHGQADPFTRKHGPRYGIKQPT